MTVIELRKALQHLEADGQGGRAVAVEHRSDRTWTMKVETVELRPASHWGDFTQGEGVVLIASKP